ncbi:hypothetical protein GCM10009850_118100 [Nonomuraea monospora]|uniref:Uncharacterized protein n=2 Tax=Nonomuraea monospora TaxID=568818 RepID=A0ABP5PX81_9ACTN
MLARLLQVGEIFADYVLAVQQSEDEAAGHAMQRLELHLRAIPRRWATVLRQQLSIAQDEVSESEADRRLKDLREDSGLIRIEWIYDELADNIGELLRYSELEETWQHLTDEPEVRAQVQGDRHRQ